MTVDRVLAVLSYTFAGLVVLLSAYLNVAYALTLPGVGWLAVLTVAQLAVVKPLLATSLMARHDSLDWATVAVSVVFLGFCIALSVVLTYGALALAQEPRAMTEAVFTAIAAGMVEFAATIGFTMAMGNASGPLP